MSSVGSMSATCISSQAQIVDNGFNEKNSLSTVKRPRHCQRRKIMTITPLKLDEIQREIEQADTEQMWDELYPISETDDLNKENKRNGCPEIQNSFELTLETPAKSTEIVKVAKRVTPSVVNRLADPPRVNRALNFQYVTPKNKLPTKVQCSVKVPPIETPITKLYATESSKKTSKTQPVQSLEFNFKKITVKNVLYIVLNELGKGGSSEVFHCYSPALKTHCAIKVVSLENRDSAVGFVKEVEMLRKLQNCNRIIKMFDFEIKEEEKILLVVLEVGGTDLSKILKESVLNTSHMPLYMLLYYWMEMLYAVQQMHLHGIIHSDLKPANFLKVEGYLKLIDFGIASCVQNDMTSVIKSVPEGSFNYISPEALNNDSANVNSPSGKPKYKLSYKSDVWSLGCILYQLVYRRTPFQHITQLWVKLATIANPNHKIEYPEADWVPQKIIDTIKRCLQVNVKLRPSVDALISEYENIFHTLS